MQNRIARAGARPSVERCMQLVTIGGSLAMVFVTGTGSPVTTAYLLELGATKYQFGLLGGIPMILLALQFVGAYMARHLVRRKPFFMIALIGGRLLYIPASLLPFLFPSLNGSALMGIYIALVSTNVALNNLATPLWMSWMGDLIPPRILNRYWGARHRYMTLVWSLAYLAVATFAFYTEFLSPRIAFPILAGIGVLAGVVDILLFAWVNEPENVHQPGRRLSEVLLEPLRDADYRTFILFGGAYSFAAMLAASFMQVYVCGALKVPIWQVNIMWGGAAIGGAFVARRFGRLADEHGQRPLLLSAIMLKPLICIVFLLATPANAFWFIGTAFIFDSMLNAGYALAGNGYLLRMAPRENRSMFVAAGMAMGGIAGGLGSITGGTILKHTESLHGVILGHPWNNYHIIFATSAVLRVLCIPLAIAIREPRSTPHLEFVLNLTGIWPMRVLTYPVGLYRRLRRPRRNARD